MVPMPRAGIGGMGSRLAGNGGIDIGGKSRPSIELSISRGPDIPLNLLSHGSHVVTARLLVLNSYLNKKKFLFT
ncbi:GSCOCG00004681001-RA-CDS [Cotesia congregata]|nr:GSCOCG00004681001-RA-CDS [Cotesia congregata]